MEVSVFYILKLSLIDVIQVWMISTVLREDNGLAYRAFNREFSVINLLLNEWTLTSMG